MLSPHQEKNDTCASCSTRQARYKKATEDQTLLGSKPLTTCCYRNIGIKRTLLLDIPHVPKIGTFICSPYSLGRCQSLDIVGWCASYNERRAKSHDFLL